MRYAIISDIHSNTAALSACLEDAGEIDALWCLGDIVGYGPEPNECVRMVRELAAHTVLGNHDAAAIGKEDLSLFSAPARKSGLWTRGRLDEDVAEFLAGLPLVVSEQDALLVHATPANPARWHYLFSVTFAQFEFAAFEEDLCFVGHSHVPAIYESCPPSIQVFSSNGPQAIRSGCRYIVNVGSVGQPRDGDPRASYALYDRAAGSVEIRRVGYDIARTQRMILDAGLPKMLAERLAYGE